jgi:hypothetical protein
MRRISSASFCSASRFSGNARVLIIVQAGHRSDGHSVVVSLDGVFQNYGDNALNLPAALGSRLHEMRRAKAPAGQLAAPSLRGKRSNP